MMMILTRVMILTRMMIITVIINFIVIIIIVIRHHQHHQNSHHRRQNHHQVITIIANSSFSIFLSDPALHVGAEVAWNRIQMPQLKHTSVQREPQVYRGGESLLLLHL